MTIALLEVDKNRGTSLDRESGGYVLGCVLNPHVTSIKFFPCSACRLAEGGISSTVQFPTLNSADDGTAPQEDSFGGTYTFKCAHPLVSWTRTRGKQECTRQMHKMFTK